MERTRPCPFPVAIARRSRREPPYPRRAGRRWSRAASPSLPSAVPDRAPAARSGAWRQRNQNRRQRPPSPSASVKARGPCSTTEIGESSLGLRSLPREPRFLAQQAARIRREVRIDGTVVATARLVPAGEIGTEDQAIGADDLGQQSEHAVVAHVGIEPQARKQRLECAVLLVRGRRPGPLDRSLRKPPDHDRNRAATMADPDVKLGMTV